MYAVPSSYETYFIVQMTVMQLVLPMQPRKLMPFNVGRNPGVYSSKEAKQGKTKGEMGRINVCPLF